MLAPAACQATQPHSVLVADPCDRPPRAVARAVPVACSGDSVVRAGVSTTWAPLGPRCPARLGAVPRLWLGCLGPHRRRERVAWPWAGLERGCLHIRASGSRGFSSARVRGLARAAAQRAGSVPGSGAPWGPEGSSAFSSRRFDWAQCSEGRPVFMASSLGLRS